MEKQKNKNKTSKQRVAFWVKKDLDSLCPGKGKITYVERKT